MSQPLLQFLATLWLSFRPYATETVGVALGVLSVWLTVRQNNWCWAVGSLSNLFFAVIFWREKLYADMVLQLVYIGLNAYGWYAWRFGGQRRTTLPVSATPALARLALISVAAAGIAVVTYYLARFTDASLPFWDATTTVLSLVAQYMLARKWIENWWVWIFVNVLYIGLYAYKGLLQASAQQLVFIALSFMGFWAWRKEWLGRTAAPAAPEAA
jgi:nicotinamide mononucleotide transporter